MADALLIGAAAVVATAVVGSGIRRWVPEAAWLGVGAAITARLLGATAVTWWVVRVVRYQVDLLRLAFAFFLLLMALWMAVVAIAMLYVALFRREAMPEGSET